MTGTVIATYGSGDMEGLPNNARRFAKGKIIPTMKNAMHCFKKELR
jgi:hypothetical protein